jgi:hypothetical protein
VITSLSRLARAAWSGFVDGATAGPARRAFKVTRFHVEMANARMTGRIQPGSWLERELLAKRGWASPPPSLESKKDE